MNCPRCDLKIESVCSLCPRCRYKITFAVKKIVSVKKELSSFSLFGKFKEKKKEALEKIQTLPDIPQDILSALEKLVKHEMVRSTSETKLKAIETDAKLKKIQESNTQLTKRLEPIVPEESFVDNLLDDLLTGISSPVVEETLPNNTLDLTDDLLADLLQESQVSTIEKVSLEVTQIEEILTSVKISDPLPIPEVVEDHITAEPVVVSATSDKVEDLSFGSLLSVLDFGRPVEPTVQSRSEETKVIIGPPTVEQVIENKINPEAELQIPETSINNGIEENFEIDLITDVEDLTFSTSSSEEQSTLEELDNLLSKISIEEDLPIVEEASPSLLETPEVENYIILEDEDTDLEALLKELEGN